MECRDCKKEFTPNPRWHRAWGLCPECRVLNSHRIKEKYKKTAKGKACLERWVHSEKRAENEKGYRQTPRRKQLAVAATTRFRLNHPELEPEVARVNRIYESRTQGKLRGWWKEHSKNGCLKCGTFEKLCIDHIIPRSLGGSDDISNLQVLCIRCNGEKGTQTIDYAASHTSDK
jgi:5-methylcytosine-specific restriction endonuclease McrA